ncbi:hypothetical protein GCM10007884_51210 [Methylobacterium brachythecii]|uniref:Reverse transcriptase domain-containing protein n=1 Tax=Methylobacterium brachythecii TaxID=1176177 RepID=A0ABQ6DFY1_9HYPH|nr:hypothetical protein GCM10007884_51210 [Methylobacterium brachythecii]
MSIPKAKWWNLKGEKIELFKNKVLKETSWTMEEGANGVWNKISTSIRKVAIDILGESKGTSQPLKETWWWNEEVQKMVRFKRECYKAWQKNRSIENFDSYKRASKETKKIVGEAKCRAYDNFYTKLDTKQGEKDIYKLAKLREKRTRDISQIKCIKNEDSRVLVQDKEIKLRWENYFKKLLNETNIDLEKLELQTSHRDNIFFRRIKEGEVKNALKKMKSGKALGPDGVPLDVWRCLGDFGIAWLTKFFNKILSSRKMPDGWRKSILVPIFKNKGDAQDCNNYRGIKLMSHTMKLWERVIEQRIRRETEVTENQFGFMPGRSTMEAIYILRKLMEKYREKKKNLHMVFIDLEKAYDRVPRELIWKALERKGVTKGYIETIKDMYDNGRTIVRTAVGETREFPVTVGLHQGSALSPYLFALVMDDLSRNIQDKVPWCMLFADDIVLVDESREGVNIKLETWREALESKGLKISRNKTEYVECNFSNSKEMEDEVVKIEGHEIHKSEWFRYLGSIIHKEGVIDADIKHRIQAGWLKWRSASSVLCDRRIPLRLKGKFYRTAIRPAILYGSECWATRKQHMDKISVAEMRMLRWMCGKTRKDKIRNEHIREILGVAPIEQKMRENRLRWFGHVQRRPLDAPVRKCEVLIPDCNTRGRGRPKLTLETLLRKDMMEMNVTEAMAFDRAHWRQRIHVADPI